jgi:CheY-like chemotaxis protein
MMMKGDCYMEKIHRKFLLVEDTSMLQVFHTYLLEKIGCTVDLAATGQEALDLFYKNSYHAIFMDVGLPDQNGVEVIQTLRAHEVRTQTPMTPVIILTAYDIHEIKQQCDCLGLNVLAVISKPINTKTFPELFEQWLN